MRNSFISARTARTARIGGGVAVALLLTGCAGQTTPVAASTPTTAVQIKADPALHAMLPKNIVSAGFVKVASGESYPPFEFYDTDGKTNIGAEPDLARALGQVLGVEFRLEPVAFASIIPGMSSGKYDIAMAGMADKKARQSAVNFVDYMTNKAGLLVRVSGEFKPKALADLCGLKVGTMPATTMARDVTAQAALCTAAGKEAPVLSQFDGQDKTILALRSKRVDVAVLTAGSAAYVITQSGGDFELSGSWGGSMLGIAVAKDNPQLAEALKAAVQKLMDEGEYKSILTKWGLFKFNSAEKAVINGAID